jgi:hypothetical protein
MHSLQSDKSLTVNIFILSSYMTHEKNNLFKYKILMCFVVFIIQLHKERMKFRSSWLRYVTHIHRRCSLCTKLNTLRSSSLKCGKTHLSMLITLREYTCLSTRAHYSNSEPTSIYFFFFNHR